MTPGYVEFSCGGGLVSANGSTGAATSVNSDSVISMEASKFGMRVISNTYVTKVDADLFDKYVESGDYDSARAILDKYNIQHK